MKDYQYIKGYLLDYQYETINNNSGWYGDWYEYVDEHISVDENKDWWGQDYTVTKEKYFSYRIYLQAITETYAMYEVGSYGNFDDGGMKLYGYWKTWTNRPGKNAIDFRTSTQKWNNQSWTKKDYNKYTETKFLADFNDPSKQKNRVVQVNKGGLTEMRPHGKKEEKRDIHGTDNNYNRVRSNETIHSWEYDYKSEYIQYKPGENFDGPGWLGDRRLLLKYIIYFQVGAERVVTVDGTQYNLKHDKEKLYIEKCSEQAWPMDDIVCYDYDKNYVILKDGSIWEFTSIYGQKTKKVEPFQHVMYINNTLYDDYKWNRKLNGVYITLANGLKYWLYGSKWEKQSELRFKNLEIFYMSRNRVVYVDGRVVEVDASNYHKMIHDPQWSVNDVLGWNEKTKIITFKNGEQISLDDSGRIVSPPTSENLFYVKDGVLGKIPLFIGSPDGNSVMLMVRGKVSYIPSVVSASPSKSPIIVRGKAISLNADKDGSSKPIVLPPDPRVDQYTVAYLTFDNNAREDLTNRVWVPHGNPIVENGTLRVTDGNCLYTEIELGGEPFVVDFWVDVRGTDSTARLFEWRGGYNTIKMNVEIRSDGKAAFHYTSSNMYSNAAPKLLNTGWHHVMYIHSGGNWIAYLDGALVSDPAWAPIQAEKSFFVIGAEISGVKNGYLEMQGATFPGHSIIAYFDDFRIRKNTTGWWNGNKDTVYTPPPRGSA